MKLLATPMGDDEKSSSVGTVIWELTKIVAIAGITAAIIKVALNRG